ncbi:MAG: AAA family ATPase [Spirochaetales bacterium]|nr:AAA family ATPase [Spirochaetales bacterium]
MNKIFCIVGMCGSGKSIACDVLRDAGWHYIRFGQITIDRLKEQGREITEENEKAMREGLRKKHGMGVFALLSLPKIEEFCKSGPVVVDGLYSWTEYKILKNKFSENLKTICIHASPEIRYARLAQRKSDANDTETRMRRLTEEQAQKRDYSEIENIEKGGPIAMADIMIINEGNLEELKAKMNRLIS